MGVFMTRVTAHKPRTAQLPESTESEILTVNGKTYEILRFPGNEGPNLEQTKAMAAGIKGKKMLTIRDAKEIMMDYSSKTAFEKVLKEGESAYVRNPRSEKESRATMLSHSHDGELYIEEEMSPDFTRSENGCVVMILKITGKGTVALQSSSRLLRVEKEKSIVLTSPSGKKTKINVPKGTTVELE
jgi:hypothetical protein